jgi:hypothetical protein
MSLRDVKKRVSDVGGNQTSEGGQRVLGYIELPFLWHRPAKHREQGSGLFHSSGCSKLRNLEAGHQHLGKTRSDRRSQA